MSVGILRKDDIILIDSRSHLEVADKKHRYAKNLRMYFKEYHRLHGAGDIIDQAPSSSGAVTPSRKWARYEPFFSWLDNEENLPELVDCPRSTLDEDRVQYLTTDAERQQYEITFGNTGDGLWRLARSGDPVSTGPKGWIFVLLNERMYACEKKTSTFPRFHHSSFFAGAGVSAAGMIVCVEGRLTKLFPHSGHYRPLDRHLYSLLAFLRGRGVQLKGVQVDVQRVLKLSRQLEKDGVKSKKTDCALYMDAETAYNFLKSKSVFQESGVLGQINKRRWSEPEPIALSLSAVPDASVQEEKAELADLLCRSEAVSPINRAAAPPSRTGSAAPTVLAAVAGESKDKEGASDLATPQMRARSRSGSHGQAVEPPLRSPLEADTPGGDVLNVSASTASSTNSPFCSPTGSYQYPVHGSAVMAGRAPMQLQQQAANDPLARISMGIRAGSPVYSAADEAAAKAASAVVQLAGLSAAESREKVLSSLLLPPAPAQHVAVPVPTSTVTRVSSHKALSSLHPPSPPVGNSSSGGTAGSSKAPKLPTAPNISSIPIPVPIRKVTSHTSISSSMGSNSYMSLHLAGGGVVRSRSHSKVDGELEYGYAYDIRALLADSPSVAPAAHHADQSSLLRGSVSISSDVCSSPTPSVNSAGNSACNSRGRSRCSSFNQPYTPASSATYANSNINISITESGLLSRLHANVASAANSVLLAEGQGEAGKAGGSVKVSPGQASSGVASSTEGSPQARNGQPPAFPQLTPGSGANSVASRSSTVKGSGGSGAGAVLSMAGRKRGLLEWDGLSPSSSLEATSAEGNLAFPTSPVLVPTAGREAGVGEAVRTPSPVPSFASSLSSCDSLPHDLLDLLEDCVLPEDGAEEGAGEGVGLQVG